MRKEDHGAWEVENIYTHKFSLQTKHQLDFYNIAWKRPIDMVINRIEFEKKKNK